MKNEDVMGRARRRWDKDAEYFGGVKWPVDSDDK